jgi:hypothetical protein
MEVAKLLGQDVYNFARALPFDFSESERQTLKIQTQGDFQEAALKVYLVLIVIIFSLVETSDSCLTKNSVVF